MPRYLLKGSLAATGLLLLLLAETGHVAGEADATIVVRLPTPRGYGTMAVEQALNQRRSLRVYGTRSLKIEEVSQVLWAAQGITSKWGGRTAPSAGGLYPIEIFLVATSVDSLAPGVYHFLPASHSMELVSIGDVRDPLAEAAIDQACIRGAPACIVLAAVTERTSGKYGNRALRYVDIEAGCVCQNIYLQCETLGLGTVAIGAFYERTVAKVLGILPEPVLLMPVGPVK